MTEYKEWSIKILAHNGFSYKCISKIVFGHLPDSADKREIWKVLKRWNIRLKDYRDNTVEGKKVRYEGHETAPNFNIKRALKSRSKKRSKSRKT